MRKKLLCTVAAVAMLSGLFVVGAAPAQAAPPDSANNFNPQDTVIGADGIDNLVLTDKNDGIDTTAHITSVATTDTTQAVYVVCPEGTTPVDEPVPPDTCETIGTDTSGEPVVDTASGQGGLDEAYEFDWAIPSTFDQITRDILAYHCIGAPTAEEPGGNCLLEIEPSVEIDDGQSGTSTTAAEYRDYCIDFNGDEDCADANEVRRPFEHPATIPNLAPGDELIVRARSSDDGITTLTSCLDAAADATTGSLDDCSINDSTGGQAAQAFKDYTFVYTDADVPDDAEMGFFLHNFADDGSGFCNGFDCLFDSHYVVSTEREQAAALKSFDPENPPPSPPEISSNAGCEDGETLDAEHSTKNLAQDIGEEGCLRDQFDHEFNGDYTVETAGVGELQCIEAGCTEHDHDDDGLVDHLHGTTGESADGVTDWELNNPNADVGDQNVTFCFESEPQTNATPPADHGCANETITDENVMHWQTQATEVFLAYAGTGTDPNDPCRTGETFKNNRVGDFEDLIACTFDSQGNPVSTQPNGASGGRLRWSIETTVGGELTGVRFTNTPPSETQDPDGQTTARIEAFRESSNFIIVELLDENGNMIDFFQVEKRIEERRGRAACDILGTNRADRIRGTNRGERICARRGNDRVRARGGNDVVLGQGGRDALFGQGGRDRLIGGPGRDRLAGGPGRDRLIGGPGRDVCIGGPGRDTFRGCEVRRQ